MLTAIADVAATQAGTHVDISVLVNDTTDGTPVELRLPLDGPVVFSISPRHGQVEEVGGDDSPIRLRYTPDEGFCGTDQFEYQIALNGETARAPVVVHVACVGCECNAPYNPGEWPSPETNYTCFDESAAQRITLTSPHVLHTMTDADLVGLRVTVMRVVRCMAGCDLDEYKYCWPQSCSGAILPPGTYDVFIPAQSAYPLSLGTLVTATLLLEPVDGDYIDAMKIMSNSNKGCGGC